MNKEFQIFAVAGKPIIHSKSPVLFNSYFNNKGNSIYIRIANDSAKELVEIIKELSITGVNITAPFKSEIIPYLDDIDNIASYINAVNLVKFAGGRLFGYNTDIDGVKYSLLNSDITLNNKNCLVIGAGGAATAAIYAAITNGAKVTILNRSTTKAKLLAEKFNCDYDGLNKFDFYVKSADIIINTIPIELLDLNLLNKNQVLLNADYKKPIPNGDFKLIDGNKWLIEQAISSLNLFTKENISSFAFENYLSNEIIKTSNNISLIGFSGSGKSTIGKSFAKKFAYDFVDTDILIEEGEGETINDIFKYKGEDYFRKVESEVLKSLSDSKKTVIATGGGMVLNESNREILKKTSNVFWIYSPIEICYSRLQNSLKPPLFNPAENSKQDLTNFKMIFNQRLSDYCSVSEVLVYNNQSIEKIVDRIYYEINQKI